MPELFLFTDTAALPEHANTGYEIDFGPRGGVVYLIEADDGRIKVGRSKHPRSRIETVARSSGVGVSRVAITQVISNSSTVESNAKAALSDYSVAGEWYNVSFEYALEVLAQECAEHDTPEEAALAKKRHESGLDGFKQATSQPWCIPKKAARAQTMAMNDALEYVTLCHGVWGERIARDLAKELGVPFALIPDYWDEDYEVRRRAA